MINYIVYKITNKLNNMIYIGCHRTYKINDNYMGSSKHLKNDIKKHGKENFSKDILFIYDNIDDMLNKEKELVDKNFCYRNDTYNKIIGGLNKRQQYNMVVLKDINNIIYYVHKDDPRYLSGELVGIGKNKITVKDKDGKFYCIDKNDERYLSGELSHMQKNKIYVKDKNGNILFINKNDQRYINGELISIHKDTIKVKNIDGKIIKVNKDNPLILNGQLKPIKKEKIIKEKIIKKYKYMDLYKNIYYISIENINNDERIKNGNIFKYIKGYMFVKDKYDNRFYLPKNDIKILNGELIKINKKQKNINKKTQSFYGKDNSIGGKIGITNLIDYKRKYVDIDELEIYLNNNQKLGQINKKHQEQR